MNKNKKIAMAVISTVMAGTMLVSLAACNPSESGKKLTPNLDENGKLKWSTTTELNMNVGNQNSTSAQGITFLSTDLSGNTALPDGQTYNGGNAGAGDLKPAWKALQTQLGLKFNDKYQNLSSDAQISTPITNKNLTDYDVVTGSMQEIVKNADYFLNLADYLDYMPNYKAFLDANPVTKYSLTGNGSTGAMYMAPYFDGNDDIEKYSMVNYLWVKDILDNDLTGKYTTTYKAQLLAKKEALEKEKVAIDATKSSATAFMGTSGSYTVATTDPANNKNTVNVKIDYDAAKTAAQSETSALGAAIKAAAGKAYTTNSGNIVDMQNFAINERAGEVTGAQLANILREYIKVTYKVGNDAFYTKLSDVFCSASACWDVDLLVAISRCVVTCGKDLTSSVDNNANIYAIAGRETTTQRRVDLQALAGELYGVRGMESRYEYTYIDNDGKIQDARLDAKSYELINNFSKLTQEGLVSIGSLAPDGVDDKGNPKYKKTSVSTDNSGTQTFMLHDYVQTQTKPGINRDSTKAAYEFGPIVNAVSKWDVNGDGSIAADEYFRFTESWRSVKNTGFGVPVDSVKNNTEKLSAVLGFIDYMFSPDGQLLMTYGPQSTNGNTNPNGWWYANKVTGKTVTEVADKIVDETNYAPAQYSVKKEYKEQYFVYNGEVYTGTAYNGTQVPTLTTLNKNFYEGKSITVTIDGQQQTIKQKTGLILIGQVGNYTNYARYFIGSTLPIGNKNQGFEYQATAKCGLDGAATVNVAIQNGTLKHVKLVLAENESPWYFIAPTALPLSARDQSTLKDDNQVKISGTYFLNTSKVQQITNVYIDLCYYALGTEAPICGQADIGNYKTTDTGAKIVALLGTPMTQRHATARNGWKSINELYELGYNV